MKKAAIDIGTNTAHLLIANVESNRIESIIYKKRFYTFLGEEGLDTISEAAIERLFDALDHFQIILNKHECRDIQVIATEGLRAASNGLEIYTSIKTKYRWPASIISGIKEAQLIFDGVKRAIDLTTEHFIIMDIGGGSVEFIICENGFNVFNQSFPIGISRLYQQFHKEEPILSFEIKQMNKWLNHELNELWSYIDKSDQNYQLIGCAGTFEVFLDEQLLNDLAIASSTVPTARLTELLDGVLKKNLNERLLVRDLPNKRAKYIVVALSLIDYMVKRLNISSFIVSKYALKEGVLVHNF